MVSFEQLRGGGLSRRQVEGLVERGELSRLHRGVFRVGPIPLLYSKEVAAVLACGPNAVLSHRSAAVVYRLLGDEKGPIHVTTIGPHRRGDSGIAIHKTSSLKRHEIRERHGIRITAPIRTLIDLSPTCPDLLLEQALAEAFALRLTNRAALLRGIEAAGPRRGVARLRRLLDAEPRRTRSNPELILLRAIRGAGLPEPETNVKIGGWEVDFFWREAGLVVEVDAYSTHSSPWAFERDRRKDAELAAIGLGVQRFTADRVRHDLDFVLAWLRQSV